MLFFRQTLLSVCLILPCALAFAQPVAGDDNPPVINEGATAIFNILANDAPGSGFTLDPATGVDMDISTPGVNDASVTTSAGTFVHDLAGIVTFTPNTGFTGSAVVQYTIEDSEPQVSAPATITVGVNGLPTITGLVPVTILENEVGGTGPLPFTIGDAETAATSLTVSGSSSNDALVPDANITFTGTGASRSITITPLTEQFGTTTITVDVSDGDGGSGQLSFLLTVTEVNDAPTITGLGPVTITEDEIGGTGPLPFTIGDAETAATALTVAGASSNDGLVPDANITFSGTGASRNVTVTPLANQFGTTTITVTVTDAGNVSTPLGFLVTVTEVNDAPTITGLGPVTILENQVGGTGALSFTIGDAETAATALTVTGASSNDGLVPDANITFSGTGASRSVTVTPLANQFGTTTITVTVTDAGNVSTPLSFLLTVTEVNDAPTITGLGPVTITEDEIGGTGPLPFTIGDAETAATALTVAGASSNDALVPDANITFSGTGASRNLTVTPLANQFGTTTITVTVTDAGNVSTPLSFLLTVTEVNDAPTITGLVPVTITEDQIGGTSALPFTIGDIETAATALTVTGASSNDALVPNANITFSGTGASRSVTVTPLANQFGTTTITVTVTDAGNVSTPLSFLLTVTEVNDAPTITGLGPVTITEDQIGGTGALPFTIGDTETAAAALTVAGSSSNDGLVPDANITFSGTGASRSVTVTPLANQSGTATITVTVTDAGNVSTPLSFLLTVTNVNDPPTITSITNQSTNEDVQTGLLPFTVGDAETAAADLEVTASSDNTGLIPNANITIAGSGASKTVQITPAANQSGVAVITLSVDDGTTTTTTSFQLSVTTVNDAPTITTIGNQTINEDSQTAALSFTISDVETAVASLTVAGTSDNITLIPNANIVITGTGATRTVQVTPVANGYGVATITLGVSDGVITTNTSFQVTVNTQNDLPTITTIGNQTINEDGATSALSFTVGDLETPVASLTVSGTSSNTTLIPNSGIVVSGAGATKSVVVTPTANRFGVATITLTVNDGTSDVATTFQVTVNAVNDAPVITGQVAVATDEEEPLEIEFTHLTATDADPDDIYPTGFTLTVLTNPGYTVVENTITPNNNVAGNIVVRVQVNDGTANSNIFNLQVTVNPVNDPPVITAQAALSVNEETPITILLSHLTITDPDNASGFTLALAQGSDYSASGNIVTPNLNFNGTLTVPVTVSDGTNTSAPFNLQITVNPVNDAPVINGQVLISIDEVQPVALELSQLTVFDPDNDYPDDFTLSILSGANYSITSNTVIPVANFSGTLLVRVFVNDGAVNSAIYNLQIQVNSTNDPPVITGHKTLSTNEGQAITIDFDDLTVTDPDNPYPTGFTLIILPGTNYAVSGTTITPNPNFDGTLTVSVKVNDGAVDSAPYNLPITVVGINNPPTITGQYPVTTPEDVEVTLRLADLQVTDPDNTFPTGFTMTISNGTNYTLSGNTIKPAANFNGTLLVPVKVNDGQLDSPSKNIEIQVTPVNDAPVITAQKVLSTLEDQPLTLSLTDFTVTDVDNNFPQDFTLMIQAGTGYQVSVNKITPNANFTGTLAVGIIVKDGSANSNFFNAEVTVNSVNDPPTLNVINNVTIQEDPTDIQTISLAGITAGAGESSQTLTVTATSDHPDWFETFELVYSGGTSGSLRVKPKANRFGTAQITVRVQDSGPGTPAPNVNFIARTFNFIIEPVNDPPIFVSQPETLVEAGQPYTYLILATDVEGEVITFAAPALPAWLTLTQNANGSATLTGTPPADVSGEIEVIIQVKDPSTTTPTDQKFLIVVNTRPVITEILVSTNEDTSHKFGLEFAENFTDLDGNTLTEIQIKQLPVKGKLILNNNVVGLDAKIPATEISRLEYVPLPDSTGTDIIKWNASDGIYYSLTDANIKVMIFPVNDPPEIIAIEPFDSDTLKYEMGSEIPVQLTKLFDARDADGDNLIAAEISFVDPLQVVEKQDQLLFKDTLGITGNYNATFGILTLTGKAPVKDYVSAIRSVKYNYLNGLRTELLTRRVSIKLSDNVFGQTKDRLVGLIYTQVELDIANAFTPNGDETNAYWRIYSPNGLDRYKDALIRVYNKRGTLVYEATGFSTPWNGVGSDGALPPDSYYYTIDLKYDKKKFKGVVTILR